MPGIPLAVTGPGGVPRRIIALVDSGADRSVFPVQWALPLGIDLAACHQIEGNTAGGKAAQYVYDPGMTAQIVGKSELDGIDFHLDAIFASTAVPLVGREDFFQTFRVEFDQRAKTFSLTTY